MFGVVLWKDEQEQKAVIWCEDHGDLAFYRNTGGSPRFEPDAGDWVQFDMTMESQQRFATNPRLVSEGVYPDIADALCAAPSPNPLPQMMPEPQKPSVSDRGSAQILPFVQFQARHRQAAAPVQVNRA